MIAQSNHIIRKIGLDIADRRQVRITGFGRITQRAMHDADVAVARTLNNFDCGMYFVHHRSTGRQKYRQSLGGHMFQEWEVVQIARCDLETLHTNVHEHVRRLDVERCRHELHAILVAKFNKFHVMLALK